MERAVDYAQGGFFDQLSFEDARNACNFKRLRVCARQIFVFSRLAGWSVPGAHAAALHGLDYLLTRLRHPAGGFIRSTALDGAPLDETRDLYDHAFVVFALAAAYRLIGDSALRDEARAVLRLIGVDMAHPSGGFVEALPPVQLRRQNPHMHLLEACLAWVPLVDDPQFASFAQDMLHLFAKHFYDPERGILFEFFDDAWRLAADPDRHLFEPGHHFEWIWLLGEARRLGLAMEGSDNATRALAATARAWGFAASGLPVGALHAGGFASPVVADSTCRIWVVTEWVRACLTEPSSGLGESGPAIDQLQRFLDVPVPGLWHERCDAVTGRFTVEPVPASSLYHIVSALEPIMAPHAQADPDRDEVAKP